MTMSVLVLNMYPYKIGLHTESQILGLGDLRRQRILPVAPTNRHCSGIEPQTVDLLAQSLQCHGVHSFDSKTHQYVAISWGSHGSALDCRSTGPVIDPVLIWGIQAHALVAL